MSSTEDYRTTALYKNAKGVADSVDATAEEVRELKVRVEKLEKLLTILAQGQDQVDHKVNTMWVKWMGNGPT